MLKLTDIPGIEVGHSTHPEEKTGCTVVLCKKGAAAGIDIRGSAPGTRETELLRPGFMIRQIHGLVLSGGSAFGLRTADGVMRYLAERKAGYDARGIIVPIVPAAVIFDLRPGRNPQIPTAEMGYEACEAAGKHFDEGLIGAGCGATVGKLLGMEFSMAGGLASAGIELPGGVRVAALVVVNALGDVVDPDSGKIVAGARNPQGKGFLNSQKFLLENSFSYNNSAPNTTLAVVATNAQFTKEEINKVARMAQNGISRAIRPAHTMHDGDIVFALSCGGENADVSVIGEVAAQMVGNAILRAIKIANNLPDIV
ncbi:MAG: P1 family peptidase [Calditrichia bacterium]